MHLVSVALFDTKQVSQVQEPGNGANLFRRLLLGSRGFSVFFACQASATLNFTSKFVVTIGRDCTQIHDLYSVDVFECNHINREIKHCICTSVNGLGREGKCTTVNSI